MRSVTGYYYVLFFAAQPLLCYLLLHRNHASNQNIYESIHPPWREKHEGQLARSGQHRPHWAGLLLTEGHVIQATLMAKYDSSDKCCACFTNRAYDADSLIDIYSRRIRRRRRMLHVGSLRLGWQKPDRDGHRTTTALDPSRCFRPMTRSNIFMCFVQCACITEACIPSTGCISLFNIYSVLLSYMFWQKLWINIWEKVM